MLRANLLMGLWNFLLAMLPHPQLTTDPRAERALRVETNIHLNEMSARIAMLEAEAKNIGRVK